MDIAILGAGSVGAALGRRWARTNHRIHFGVRDIESPRLRALLDEIGPAASAMTNARAAASAQVVVIATPWRATREALDSCGPLAGETLIDCTNPLKADLSGLEDLGGESAAERIARWTPGAFVCKAFNTTGAANMASQEGYPLAPVMLVAGDDPAPKATVLRLAADAGFDPIDAGPLVVSRLLEASAMLWIHLALRQGMGSDFALALMRRNK